ncbi:MAG: dehydrogenase [Bacteroidales bacterium]|nr:dehydrogenase [Bacteroidales bacterium]
MRYCSRAPYRIGLAGGGTDVSPYSDIYGGGILNATVSMYASAEIEPLDGGRVIFSEPSTGLYEECDAAMELPAQGAFALHKGVYNRMVRDYAHRPLSLRITTTPEVPSGSGLGTSSTMMVAIVGAFAEWLGLPLGGYDIAWLAYCIERRDLGMAGGKQDQYAATFGGFNFMDFLPDDKVIVNPMRVSAEKSAALCRNLLLYYTQTRREGADIIVKEAGNVAAGNETVIASLHEIKRQALAMKEALLKGELDRIGEILDIGWQNKKRLAQGISNPVIDNLYSTAMAAGSTGGKISGAGGGGFILFYCPEGTRESVENALRGLGGKICDYHFTKEGLCTWTEK